MIRKGFLILILLLVNGFSFSQTLQLDFLFSSGVTLNSELHTAAKLNDSVDFNFNKQNIQFVVPLKTKINLNLKNFDLKKMNLSSSQLFLTSSIGIVNSSFSNKNNNIYKSSFGVTGLNAGIRQGIWIYSGNIFIDESNSTIKGDLVPNFKGYGARVKVKSFDFIFFYGAGVVVNQGKIIPFPIVGLQKKVVNKLKASIIFPLEAKLNYKINSKTNFTAGANFDGLNTIVREGSVFKDSDISINYRQLKPYLSFSTKVTKQLKLKMDGGMSVAQQYSYFNNDYNENIGSSYFIAFTLNYQFGKSLFGQFINPQ